MKKRIFLSSLIALSCMFALPTTGVAEEPTTSETTEDMEVVEEQPEEGSEESSVMTADDTGTAVEESEESNEETTETAEDSESAVEQTEEESSEETSEITDDTEALVEESEGEFTEEASVMTVDVTDEVTVVYLGGKGKDTNDGLTKETPVQTFAKAKEILSENGGTIYVVSTIEVPSSEAWDGQCAKGIFMTRADGFDHDPMVHVKNSGTVLTITNLVLDGGSERGMKITGSGNYQQICSIVDMASGRAGYKLVLGEGAVLQNNYAYQTSAGTSHVRGGAITVQSTGFRQYINIDGGTIKNCNTSESGGAIYGFYGTVVNLINGSIENCHAINSSENAVANGYGNGGGIYLSLCGILNVEGGVIKDCTSSNYGGGAFLDYSTFKMSGGSIESNTTGLCGGGLVLGNETDGHIFAGSFINNVANGADANSEFAGGGIYVSSHLDGERGDSTLEMNNLVVSNNYAKNGGGIAVCGFGDVTLTEGAAIFNNTSSGNVKDLYIVSGGETDPDGKTYVGEETKRYVSPAMLGNGAYNWSDANGNLMELTDVFKLEKSFFGNANPSAEAIAAANNAKTVYFSGNQAPNGYGGGIADNGVLTVGKVGEELDFSVEKTWEDDNLETIRPDKIKVSVKRNGEYYGFVYVTKDDEGNWKTEFTGLQKFDVNGNAYTYEIEESLIYIDDENKEVETKSKEYVYQVGDETNKVILIPDVNENNAYEATYKKIEDTDASFEITNEHYKGVLISKTDITGTKGIGDAKLVVKNEMGEVVDSWISQEDKDHQVFLKDGTYTLSETEAPDNYEKADDITFTVLGDKITIDDEEVEKIVMKDDYIEHEFHVLKIDSDNQPLSDAKFVLSSDQEGNDVIASWSSSTETYTLSLKPGTYYLEEVEAPNGYDKVSGVVEIEIAVDGSLNVKASEEDAELVSYDADTVTVIVENKETPKPPVTEEGEEKPHTPETSDDDETPKPPVTEESDEKPNTPTTSDDDEKPNTPVTEESHERPNTPETPDNNVAPKPLVPSTSDSGLGLWIMLIGVSLATFALITKVKKHSA